MFTRVIYVKAVIRIMNLLKNFVYERFCKFTVIIKEPIFKIITAPSFRISL